MKPSLEKIMKSGKRIVGTAFLVWAFAAASLSTCAKTSPPAQTYQASANSIVGGFSVDAMLSVYYEPFAENVAKYQLVVKNTSGRELH